MVIVMKVEGLELDTEVSNIIHLLREELSMQGINLLGAVRDTPDNYMISCPYHKGGQERKPSAGIKKSDGTFHCFACNEVHSLPEVISYCFGYNDSGWYGHKWLIQNFVVIERERRNAFKLDIPSRENPFRSNTDSSSGDTCDSSADGSDKNSDGVQREFVSEEELSTYRYYHPYMYKRGLTDKIIDLFDIGYDKATECITFPVRDIEGNCLFVARRSVKTKFFNYPAGAEKPLYGLYEYMEFYNRYAMPVGNNYVLIAGRGNGKTQFANAVLNTMDKLKEIVVCESMLDALSFWCVGKFAVALNGLGNELQFQQLRDLPCRTIILATDMDDAGQMARRRLRKALTNKVVFEYKFPAGRKDANDCTKEELMQLKKELI